MQKYPNVLFFRYDQYKSIDDLLIKNKDSIDCNIRIINSSDALSNLFDTNTNVLVTFGPDEGEYSFDVFSVIAKRMVYRWIHYKTIDNLREFSRGINYCYIDSVIKDRELSRPVFSVFTTTYNSYEKIKRPLKTLLDQTLNDWEWVVLDDSPTDDHFNYLRELFKDNTKIRLYRRDKNSGNIGNVKNEATSLCRGKYILELDHDDEITENLLLEAKEGFEKNPDVGFIYTDFINMYENGSIHSYGDFFGLGYAGYYREKIRNIWANVYVAPQINNITLAHLVSLPNHPRIWRRETLMKIGNYSEFLPINDDQEILMRTCMETIMMKIPGIGYIQYMNENNNNFSLIRNSEINRIGPFFLQPQFYEMYKVHAFMKNKNAYDDEKYMYSAQQIWLRDSFQPPYCSRLYQVKYDTQYCIIGRDIFLERLQEIKELYKNPRNDFFLIDSTGDNDGLCRFLDSNGFDRMKCYTIKDLTVKQMIQYFHLIYKTVSNGIILS